MEYTDEDLKLIMKRAQERLIKVNQEALDELIKEDYRKSVHTLAEQCGIRSEYAERLINKLDEEYSIKHEEYLSFYRQDTPYSNIYDENTWTLKRKYHDKCILCNSGNHMIRNCGSRIK